MQAKKTVFSLISIIVLISIVRIVVFWDISTNYPDHIQTPDSSGYISSAIALVKTGRFLVSSEPSSGPEWGRTPGYPLFLSAIFSIWFKNLQAVGIAQIIISAITLALAAWLAFQITHSYRVTLFTGILLAIDIPTFLHTQLILTETFFTLVVVLIGILGVGWIKSTGRRRKQNLIAFACGIVIAFSTLVRPISYYLPFAIVIVLLLAVGLKKLPWKTVFTTASLLIIPWIILVGGWQIRNYLQVGCSDISKIEGLSFLYYRGAGIIAARDHIPFTDAQNNLRNELSPQSQSNIGCGPEKAAGIQIIRENPGLFIIEEVKGFIAFFKDSNAGDFLVYLNTYYSDGMRSDIQHLSFVDFFKRWIVQYPLSFVISIYARLYVIILYLMIIIGIIQLGKGINLRNEKSIHQNISISGGVFLILLSAYFAVISAGPEAYARFRVPVTPFFCIFAGLGLDMVIRTLDSRKRRNIEQPAS
jgi:hypothetical protein